jgi:hypothetical protein
MTHEQRAKVEELNRVLDALIDVNRFLVRTHDLDRLALLTPLIDQLSNDHLVLCEHIEALSAA